MARKNLKIPSGVNEELYRLYRTLADQADKRLERLEKLSQTNEIYHGVTAYAYRKAQEAISYWDNDKYNGRKPRFARNHPTTEKELKAKIKDIEAFLEMPTSTKTGIDKTYKNRAKGLNEEFGTNFTWQEWARFGARDFWSGKDGVGYRELIAVASREKAQEEISKKVKSLDKALRNNSKLPRDIKKAIKSELSELSDDILSKDKDLIQKTINTIFEDNEGIVLKQAKRYMKQSGLTYKDMFT